MNLKALINSIKQQIASSPFRRRFESISLISPHLIHNHPKLHRLILLGSKVVFFILIFYIFIFLLVPRRYSTRYIYNLPGDKITSNISLPEIGSTKSTYGSSGYATSTFDPRENYRAIFLSDPVIQAAKKISNLEKFPLPRIELRPNSTLISVIFTASSIEQSIVYSNSFNAAALSHISKLRRDSIAERRKPIDYLISDIDEKLKLSQLALSNFQANNDLKSDDQISKLINTISDLKIQKTTLKSQFKRLGAETQLLLGVTGLNQGQIRDAYILRSDILIKDLVAEYSSINASIRETEDIYGKNHPQMQDLLTKKDSLISSLLNRSQALLDYSPDTNTLGKLILVNDSSTRDLNNQLTKLIDIYLRTMGTDAELNEINKQIRDYEVTLKKLLNLMPEFANLKRQKAFSEAVLAAALANLENSESNFFEGYPQIQVIAKPSTQLNQRNLYFIRILIGFILTSIFALLGLCIYIYKPQDLRSLLK